MDISNITVNAQSSIRIDYGKVIYVDPFSIEESLQDADYIFLTHDHYDHYSVEDIKKIIKVDTKIVAPQTMADRIKSDLGRDLANAVKPDEKTEVFGLSFETVPAYNKLKPFHSKKVGWVGYILCIDELRIYIAGDTDATDEASKVNCDIALIPIGGTFTMNYKEAAKLINKMKPKIAIPTHYGKFVGSKSDGDNFRKLVDKDIEVILKLQ